MPEKYLTSGRKQAIYDLATVCWEIAENHGWHEGEEKQVVIPGRFEGQKVKAIVPRSFGEHLLLWVSEIAEALEEYRNHQPLNRMYRQAGLPKPEGVPVEFADLFIRMLDTMMHYEMVEIFLESLDEKMQYNEERPYRHGGKAL